MPRKLFCEWSPLTYRISTYKNILQRRLIWLFNASKYAHTISDHLLPVIIFEHQSMIRRKLGDVDMQLQENKAHNLALAAPHINRVLVRPGETFSFWKLVGDCSIHKGFKEGLVIKKNTVNSGIGGGMCQFSNLLHWMVLHSPLEIIEHHHHGGLDMFPDHNRKVPFGTGTSIVYNYIDYQFRNPTTQTFQVIAYTTGVHLCGELRAEHPLEHDYQVHEQDQHFTRVGDTYYRHNKVYQVITAHNDGRIIEKKLIVENSARVLYNSKYIPSDQIVNE